MRDDNGRADFARMDDATFLAERARVREQLEHTPADAVGCAELTALYARINDEFYRRAGTAWTSAGAS